MTNLWKYRIRRIHRYLGVLLGIQFLFWTVGGLYFSWSNMEEIHSDPQKRRVAKCRADIPFVSPSIPLAHLKQKIAIDSVLNVNLLDILGKPTYRIEFLHEGHHKMYQLADAQTGELRAPLTTEEAITVAKQRFNGAPTVKSVEILTDEVSGHHEYRENPLPAVAVTFEHPTETTVYVATNMGVVTKYRNAKWRIFDFLWMMHTMDYQSRDNIGNWLLRLFSIMGLMTIGSGFLLYFVSSVSIQCWKKS